MSEATPNLREARRMLGKGIVIAGVGETEQGKLEGRGSFQLLAEVTKITLDDAGITLADVDGMVTAFSFVESTLMHATTFADYLGMAPGYFASVAVGGATAPLMAVQAALAIDAGLAEVVLCVRGDNTRSGISSSGMIAMAREMSHGAYEAPYGLTTIGGYGLLAQRYMYEHDVPQEALAAVVATQSEHAALKWNAMLRDSVTIEDVMNDRWIATPFHAMDCSLVSDGAAAFIVTTADRAKSMRPDARLHHGPRRGLLAPVHHLGRVGRRRAPGPRPRRPARHGGGRHHASRTSTSPRSTTRSASPR